MGGGEGVWVTYTDAVVEPAVVEGAQERDEIDDQAEQTAHGREDAEHGADVEQGVLLRWRGRPILRGGVLGLGGQQGRLQVALGRGIARGARLLARVHRVRHVFLLLHLCTAPTATPACEADPTHWVAERRSKVAGPGCVFAIVHERERCGFGVWGFGDGAGGFVPRVLVTGMLTR
jgi:hypothetical protein